MDRWFQRRAVKMQGKVDSSSEFTQENVTENPLDEEDHIWTRNCVAHCSAPIHCRLGMLTFSIFSDTE